MRGELVHPGEKKRKRRSNRASATAVVSSIPELGQLSLETLKRSQGPFGSGGYKVYIKRTKDEKVSNEGE